MESKGKFLKLLLSLKEATAQGRIEWSKGVDLDAFYVILDRATVQISKQFDEISYKSEIDATLVDAKGDILDSVSTAELDTPEHRMILNDLYDLARRRGNRVDELLDHLISDVDSRRG